MRKQNYFISGLSFESFINGAFLNIGTCFGLAKEMRRELARKTN